jgi:hypothetical protein
MQCARQNDARPNVHPHSNRLNYRANNRSAHQAYQMKAEAEPARLD